METLTITTDEQEVDFRDALYRSKCGTCGDELTWEAAFDADGTNYYTKCCGLRYAMYPAKVIVQASR